MPTPPSTLPLWRYPSISTTDFDEAAHIYGRLVTPVRVTRTTRRLPFSWHSNQRNVGAISLSANEFAGGTSAESASPVNHYHLSFPLSAARGEATVGSGVFSMVQGKSALISSPGDCAKIVLQPSYQGLTLNIPTHALLDAMTTLTGDTPRALTFQRRLALDSPKTEPFLGLLRQLAANANGASNALADPEAAALAVEPLLFQLLLCLPHNQEAALNANLQAAEPRYVRRAVDYLETHFARPITMAELTRETGVGARSLQVGFQRSRGCSPLQYLQQRRLRFARVMLLTGDDQVAVGQVAQLAGFQHMGRFSVQYRAQFGETPTSTRARRHKR